MTGTVSDIDGGTGRAAVRPRPAAGIADERAFGGGASGRCRSRSVERPLFWRPLPADGPCAARPDRRAATPEGAWLHRSADTIEALRAALPSDASLRDRGCMTAAVYVEGARRSLAIAVDSLRWTAEAAAGPDPLAELRDLDPLLAEWLN